MKSLCDDLKIKHHNSFSYGSKMNGVIDVANKNVKKYNAKDDDHL